MNQLTEYISKQIEDLEKRLDHKNAYLFTPATRGSYRFNSLEANRIICANLNYKVMLEIIEKQKELISLLMEESKNKNN